MRVLGLVFLLQGNPNAPQQVNFSIQILAHNTQHSIWETTVRSGGRAYHFLEGCITLQGEGCITQGGVSYQGAGGVLPRGRGCINHQGGKGGHSIGGGMHHTGRGDVSLPEVVYHSMEGVSPMGWGGESPDGVYHPEGRRFTQGKGRSPQWRG